MVTMKKSLTSLLLLFIVSAMLFSIVKIEPALATVLFSDGFEDGTHNAWVETGTVDINSVHVKTGSYSANTTWVSHSSFYFLSKTIAGSNTFLKLNASVYFSALSFTQETVYGRAAVEFMRLKSDGVEYFDVGVLRDASDTDFVWAILYGDSSQSYADAGSLNPVAGSWFDVCLCFSINGSGTDYYDLFINGTAIWSGSGGTNYGATLGSVSIGVIDYNEGATFTPTFKDYFDDITVDDTPLSPPPPSEALVRFRAEPSGLFSVHFGAGGSWYWSPQDLNLAVGSQTFTIESGSLIRIVNDTWIYGFDHWSITNTTGTFNSTGSSVDYNLQEDTNITMAYTTIRIQVTASPALPVYFSSEYYGSNYSAPQTLNWNSGSHTFTALNPTYSPNSSYIYTFDHWLVNGTDQYGSLGITLTFTADTNLTIAYVGSTVTPSYPYTYVSGALNATWYFRSDTWTVHSILGYKLQTVNTATPAFDERIDAATKNVSYGVRVWALDLFGNQYELTSGSPAAVATKITEGSEMMLAYWTCPAYSSMIDSIKINLYQQFNDEGWSLRRIYVTGSDLLIRLPSASWTFHYYVNRTVGSTYSTFGFGSYTTYNSRIDLQYYKASPWDVALARLWQRNFVGFLFTPWTYWFGDLFWSIILFGCIIMAWMRTGSFKPVLALLWIIGGSGSILWALIPATALHIAVLMLALAMAITLFRLIYGRRT